MLYHGSDTDFDMFDDAKISSGDASELFGKGYYLTDNIEVAKFYAKQKAKSHKIVKYSNTGIFGTPIPHYDKGADMYAQDNYKVNKFLVNGNILNIQDYIISDDFKKYIIDLYVKYGHMGERAVDIAEGIFNYLRNNKQKIYQYRGEIWYIVRQLILNDKNMMNGVIEYIKNMGYDGLKYKPDLDYEGNEMAWNYVIYNKNVLKKMN